MYDLTYSIHVNPIHYIYDIISTMCDNTTLCVVDITLGICVTSFVLQMILHPFYHTKPQYLWCHIHFRHDMTHTVSDITPTVSLSSQPLHWYHTHFCMTSYPLICVTSYALYIKPYKHLMSSHYRTYDITASIYETTSSM